MGVTPAVEKLAKQKLEAFQRLQTEFEESFHFVQEIHGQRRFPAISVAEIVHYLHALWVCECKDRLLSVYKNIERYQGRHCLEVLRRWQEGETADIIEFLHHKLDGFPFVQLTRQIQEATSAHSSDDGLVRRLKHGRLTLLNRSMNLMQALDTIFALPEDQLIQEVRASCSHYGHKPDQIAKDLAKMDDPLYSFMPHQLLARQNMLTMNKMGVAVMTLPTDRPGERSSTVGTPSEPVRSFAEQTIEGYLPLI